MHALLSDSREPFHAHSAVFVFGPSALIRQPHLPPALALMFLIIICFPPQSLSSPSIFFNLESIDIQPMDDLGSYLRVCAEFLLSNITLGRGLVAAKLQFSPDGPSAVSHTASDVLCVDGVERGGRYRAQIMLVDDRDGSELPSQLPPPGFSSMFEMLFGWHSEAAFTSPPHGSITFSSSPQAPVVICHRTHVAIPHLQPASHDGGLQLESLFTAFVLSVNGRPLSVGHAAAAAHSCTTADVGWGRHAAVLEWFNVVEEWQPWWQQQLEASGGSGQELLRSPEIDRALNSCCSAMGSLLAFCSGSFKARRADFVPAHVADCPFLHASGAGSVVFSVADSSVPLPPPLQQLLLDGKYVESGHVFATTEFPPADPAIRSALPIIEALAGNCSRCLNASRFFNISAAPPSPTESLFNPCVFKSHDGTFRFTARAHDLSDKFLLTRRRSRVVAGSLAAGVRLLSELDLLYSSSSTLAAIGLHNISLTGAGNPPPYCSPGEQDARVIAPDDADGCSMLFLFAPHQHLPARGGIAAARYCWPPLPFDASEVLSSSDPSSSQPQELRFVWLSHSPIEKNWPIWKADPASDAACSDSPASITCGSTAPETASRFLFARTIEPHDIYQVKFEMQAASLADGVASHVAATSSRALQWLHDNTPFWIHGGSPPVAVPYAPTCIAALKPCQHRSSNGTVMVAVGHAKNPFTFTYVNFLYAFSSSLPHNILGWVALRLDARVTMGMCLQQLDDSRSLLLSYGHSDSSMRMALYGTSESLQAMMPL